MKCKGKFLQGLHNIIKRYNNENHHYIKKLLIDLNFDKNITNFKLEKSLVNFFYFLYYFTFKNNFNPTFNNKIT